MRYIKFEHATGEILVPDVGPIPFFVEGKTAVVCIELSKQDIKDLIVNNGRLYILGPTAPGGDRPLFFKPVIKPPFADGTKNKNGQAPGKS
jgi:hypothetical protein